METKVEEILKKWTMRYDNLHAEPNDVIIEASDFINIAQEIVKLFSIPVVINCVPYQICPKCAGDGDLFRYHSPALMGTNARPICDVCEGKKIIPMAHCL